MATPEKPKDIVPPKQENPTEGKDAKDPEAIKAAALDAAAAKRLEVQAEVTMTKAEKELSALKSATDKQAKEGKGIEAKNLSKDLQPPEPKIETLQAAVVPPAAPPVAPPVAPSPKLGTFEKAGKFIGGVGDTAAQGMEDLYKNLSRMSKDHTSYEFLYPSVAAIGAAFLAVKGIRGIYRWINGSAKKEAAAKAAESKKDADVDSEKPGTWRGFFAKAFLLTLGAGGAFYAYEKFGRDYVKDYIDPTPKGPSSRPPAAADGAKIEKPSITGDVLGKEVKITVKGKEKTVLIKKEGTITLDGKTWKMMGDDIYTKFKTFSFETANLASDGTLTIKTRHGTAGKDVVEEKWTAAEAATLIGQLEGTETEIPRKVKTGFVFPKEVDVKLKRVSP